MRKFDQYIGVDLGGGKGKNTAVALLQGDEKSVRVTYVGRRDPEGRPFFDRTLGSYLRGHPGALVALGAPTTLSKCVRCQLPSCPGLDLCTEPVIQWFREVGKGLVTSRLRGAGKPTSTPYTQRACELVMQHREGITPRETFGQGMGPLTARAHYLCRQIAGTFARETNLIEVYPKATVQRLFGAEAARGYKRAADTWRVRAAILEALSSTLRFEVWREGCLQDDHLFDAVLCAYTGYLWARDDWQLPQEDRDVFAEDGWIWFPPQAPTS